VRNVTLTEQDKRNLLLVLVNVILMSCPKRSVHFIILHGFSIVPMRATFPAYLISFDLITLIFDD
jgi:hypothetical protein